MALIGEFGIAADATDDPDTFLWHGVEFVVPPKISALPVMRFAWEIRGAGNQETRARRKASGLTAGPDRDAALKEASEAEMAQLAALHVFLRDTIGAAQWEEFEALAVEHGDGVDEIMRVAQAIYSSVVDRPTGRPSSSSGGPPQNGTGLPVPSAFGEPTAGPMTPAAAQRAAIRAALVPVDDVIRSSA